MPLFNNKDTPEIFSSAIIAHHPFFSSMSINSMVRIAPYFEESSINKGDHFDIECEQTSRWFLVKKGKINIDEIITRNNEIKHYELEEGQSAGSLNIVDPAYSVLKCNPQEDCDILFITKTNFDKMVGDSSFAGHDFYMNICKDICLRLLDLNKKYVDLYLNSILLKVGN